VIHIGRMIGIGTIAGGALVFKQLVLEELDTIEEQAVGVAVVGMGFTAYMLSEQHERNEQLITAYWTTAAIAAIPAVVCSWARRQRTRALQRAREGVAIATKDYRGEQRTATPPPRLN
jgi:DNA-binding transcriptional regulator YbjK